MSLALPDFIKRAVAFFDKADANLTATEQLTQANARIATLEKELSDAQAASSQFTVQITDLNAKLETAQAEVNAKGTEVKNLQAELATAKGTANAVIAAQGLAAEKLPALDPDAHAGGAAGSKTLTLTERCLAANSKANARN